MPFIHPGLPKPQAITSQGNQSRGSHLKEWTDPHLGDLLAHRVNRAWMWLQHPPHRQCQACCSVSAAPTMPHVKTAARRHVFLMHASPAHSLPLPKKQCYQIHNTPNCKHGVQPTTQRQQKTCQHQIDMHGWRSTTKRARDAAKPEAGAQPTAETTL